MKNNIKFTDVSPIICTILMTIFLVSTSIFIMQLVGYIRIWDIRFSMGAIIGSLGLLLTVLTSDN